MLKILAVYFFIATGVAFGSPIRATAAEKPVLINGRPANPADWPASIYITSGGSRCSSTLVGDSVVLTAAHCVKNGGIIEFINGPGRYQAQCDHHPEYRHNPTADWALCLLDRKITHIKFETIMAKPLLKLGQEVLLTGYGCTEEGGRGSGGNDGIFRIGEAYISRLPSGRRNYDTVATRGAALCFGDSGGSAYATINGNRMIFGVNSRGDIATTSYLSSTWFAIDWMNDWAAENRVEICGVTSAAKSCRGLVNPEPKPTPTPSPEGGKCEHNHECKCSCKFL